MISSRSFLVFALAVLFAGCASSTKVTGLSALPGLAPSASGAALPVQLSGDLMSGGRCTLFVRKSGEAGTYGIAFEQGKDILVSELPAGDYGFTELTCDGRIWKESPARWARFKVIAGKISLLGGLKLMIAKAGELEWESYDHLENQDEALKLLGRLSTAKAADLISGYTGLPITHELAASPPLWKKWELVEGGKQKFETKDDPVGEWPSFKACYRGERSVNPLWLGNLKFEAEYENAKMLRMKQGDLANLFTPQLVECVRSALKGFHPRRQGRVRYTVFI